MIFHHHAIELRGPFVLRSRQDYSLLSSHQFQGSPPGHPYRSAITAYIWSTSSLSVFGKRLNADPRFRSVRWQNCDRNDEDRRIHIRDVLYRCRAPCTRKKEKMTAPHAKIALLAVD